MAELQSTINFLDYIACLSHTVDTDISDERRAYIEAFVAGKNASDYLLVLANDFDSLQARAYVHRHVYTDDYVTRADYGELGSATTSRINGCVSCASVHARHVANYPKYRAVAQRLLDDGVEADLPRPSGPLSM